MRLTLTITDSEPFHSEISVVTAQSYDAALLMFVENLTTSADGVPVNVAALLLGMSHIGLEAVLSDSLKATAEPEYRAGVLRGWLAESVKQNAVRPT